MRLATSSCSQAAGLCAASRSHRLAATGSSGGSSSLFFSEEFADMRRELCSDGRYALQALSIPKLAQHVYPDSPHFAGALPRLWSMGLASALPCLCPLGSFPFGRKWRKLCGCQALRLAMKRADHRFQVRGASGLGEFFGTTNAQYRCHRPMCGGLRLCGARAFVRTKLARARL